MRASKDAAKSQFTRWRTRGEVISRASTVPKQVQVTVEITVTTAAVTVSTATAAKPSEERKAEAELMA